MDVNVRVVGVFPRLTCWPTVMVTVNNGAMVSKALVRLPLRCTDAVHILAYSYLAIPR